VEVSFRTSSVSATLVSQLPLFEMDCPMKNNRKFLWRSEEKRRSERAGGRRHQPTVSQGPADRARGRLPVGVFVAGAAENIHHA
jgi:hypothetical protein